MQLALQHKKQSTRLCSMNNFRQLGKAAGRVLPGNLFMEGPSYKFQYQTRQSSEVIRMNRRSKAHGHAKNNWIKQTGLLRPCLNWGD